MKEYTILCICNGGCPYYLPFKPYNDLASCILRLREIVQSNSSNNILSYVDNSFWNNDHSELACNFYYQIQERSVGEWHKSKIIEEEKNNNIIFLKHIDNL